MSVFIITGISRGLGEEIYKILNKKNENIIGVGRTFTREQEDNAKNNPSQFKLIKGDLSNPNELSFITEKLENIINNEYKGEVNFINNAGIVYPIKKIGDFNSQADVIEHININYIAPLLITNSLLQSKFKLDNRSYNIINITSGAAEKPIEGWSLYCSTKKAIKTFFDVLKEEYSNVNIQHIDPGVLDTDMQKKIRESNEDDFPALQQFMQYKENGELLNADDVARNILEVFIK